MLVPLRAVDKFSDDITVKFFQGGPKLMDQVDPPLLAETALEADLIVAQRANSFDGMGAWRRFRTPTCRTVYENDDDVWHITPDNVNAYESYKEGNEAREVVLRLCMTASGVTTSSPYLGDLHRELTPQTPVFVLPNYIPEYALHMPHDDRQGRPRLGWIGGASHNRDIGQATTAVRRFMKRSPQWDFVVSGVDYRKEFGCPPERSYHVPWIHVCNEPGLYYRMIDFDIGICPLLDTKFSRSKSWIKALEYMARGTPVIASDVEPYRRFIKHGVNGFLVKREHEWLSALSELAGDDKLRAEMGANAYAHAAENTIEKHWQEWANAYKTLFPVGWSYKA